MLNTPPVLIGLCGKRGSGKNTAADSMVSWGRGRGISVSQKAFASKLKHMTAIAFGFEPRDEAHAVEIIDYLKDQEVRIDHPDQDGDIGTIPMRGILQRLGTEGHRNLIHPNFWVERVLPVGEKNGLGVYEQRPWIEKFVVPGEIDFPAVCVVTDVRFENEAQRIKDLGGEVWEIDRPSLANQRDSHATELGIPASLIDEVLVNSGTLEEFDQLVFDKMTARFGVRFNLPEQTGQF
jgi:hypothetical protein